MMLKKTRKFSVKPRLKTPFAVVVYGRFRKRFSANAHNTRLEFSRSALQAVFTWQEVE